MKRKGEQRWVRGGLGDQMLKQGVACRSQRKRVSQDLKWNEGRKWGEGESKVGSGWKRKIV